MYRLMHRPWLPLLLVVPVATAGCGTFTTLLGPEAAVPTRPMQRVLPVPRLVAPAEAVGSCVRYAPDGSFVLEACPAALTGVATNATDYKVQRGEHVSEMFIVDPKRPPPGFSGAGGHWHVHEAHITRVITSPLGSGKLGALNLDRLDALCRDVGRGGDRVIVDRAYAGCAAVADGNSGAPETPGDAFEQLVLQKRRLGGPASFVVDEKPVSEASCEGEETTILVGVVTLSAVCNDVVRDMVLARLSKEAAATAAEVGKVEHELAAKELALASIDTHDKLAREKAAPILAALPTLESQLRALREVQRDTWKRVELYRGDVYGLDPRRAAENDLIVGAMVSH